MYSFTSTSVQLTPKLWPASSSTAWSDSSVESGIEKMTIFMLGSTYPWLSSTPSTA